MLLNKKFACSTTSEFEMKINRRLIARYFSDIFFLNANLI